MCDLNAHCLDSDRSVYSVEKQLHHDLFLVKYNPTGDLFGLRKTNLDILKDVNFVVEEIRVTKSLRHANILPFLASFVFDDHLWTITLLADYGSISQLSKPTGLPELAIALVVRDVLKALAYLHKQGIIHRAVRGSHVLVTGTGRCLLSGLKYSTSVMRDGKWQTTIYCYPENAESNLKWLAPEVLEQNLFGYNAKSDIYSLGIICCELANGCIPFEGLEPTEMLLDKLTGNFPRPLDATCEEIKMIPCEDMNSEVREKYECYKLRKFSESFHNFTVDLCLHFDPNERPPAVQLLNHSFIKQAKKSSTNLLSLIPNKTKLVDHEVSQSKEMSVDEKMTKLNLEEQVNWDFVT